LCFGHEHAGLRQVDELSQEIGRAQRTRAAIGPHSGIAQGDDSFDIGDTGRSDQVFHADGSNLAGSATRVLDRDSTEMTPGPAIQRRRRATNARDALKDAADRYCIQVADA
jgi:hypothetical protein